MNINFERYSIDKLLLLTFYFVEMQPRSLSCYSVLNSSR